MLADSEKWAFFSFSARSGKPSKGESDVSEHGTSRKHRRGATRSTARYTVARPAPLAVQQPQVFPISACHVPPPHTPVPTTQAELAVGAPWAMTCPRFQSGDDRREIGRFCVCVAHSPQISMDALPRRTTKNCYAERTRARTDHTPRTHVYYIRHTGQ